MKQRNISCMKFFLTLFNIICLICALVVVCVCALELHAARASAEGQGQGQTPPLLSRGAASFLTFVGVLLLLTAGLGCLGALRAHTNTLYWYAGLFIFLVSCEAVVGVAAALYSAWQGQARAASDATRDLFYDAVAPDADAKRRAYWDNIQIQHQCCGLEGPGDYGVAEAEVPASCCARVGRVQGRERARLHAACLTAHAYYQDGCDAKLLRLRTARRKIFVSTALLFTLFEIACIVLALWLAHCVRRERRRLQQNLQSHYES